MDTHGTTTPVVVTWAMDARISGAGRTPWVPERERAAPHEIGLYSVTLNERERKILQEIADATMARDAALARKLSAPMAGRSDPVVRWAVRAFSAVVMTLLVGGLVRGDESLLAGAGLVLVTFPMVVWFMSQARQLGT
jgi:DUF3040 family protein